MPETPIPERCAGQRMSQGMLVPYITLEIDGKIMWGETRGIRVTECFVERRCQLCGEPLTGRLVFLVTEAHLAERFTREPALHPECALYAQRACPMIAGRMAHYSWALRNHTGKPCSDPGCDCSGWVSDQADNRGRRAEAWFVAWFDGYTIGIRDPRLGLVNGNVSGAVLDREPLKVRPVNLGARARTGG